MSKKLYIYLNCVLVFLVLFSLGDNKLIDYKMHGYNDLYYYVGENAESYSFSTINADIEHNNQLANYFSNLNNNIPFNENGSCGYVSAAMILLYYDTFFNNNIVDDSFVVKNNANNQADLELLSPGHINDFADLEKKPVRYYNHVKANPNKSLHYNLMSKGLALNIVPNSYNYIDVLDGVSAFGLTNNELYSVINKYLIDKNLNNLFTFSWEDHMPENSDYSDGSFTSEYVERSLELKEDVKDLVLDGYPVLVGISYFDEFGNVYGHLLIAYDYYIYNSNIDLLYHTGYVGGECVKLTGSYYVNGYVTLVPNGYSNHVCSNNYLLNNSGVCPCTFSNHVHKFINYSSINSLIHNKICYCGYSVSDAHKMTTGVKGNYCSLCGYISQGFGPVLTYMKGEEYDV